jgi:hypothetical protein
MGVGFGVGAALNFRWAQYWAAAGDSDSLEANRPLYYVCIAGAGIGAGLAVVGIIVTASSKKADSVAFGPGPGDMGLSVGWSF